MPVAHDHDDEAYDATDTGDEQDVTLALEAKLRREQLDVLKEAGFHA